MLAVSYKFVNFAVGATKLLSRNGLTETFQQVLNKELGLDLFKYSALVTGAQWPPANQPKSPCPTLVVLNPEA